MDQAQLLKRQAADVSTAPIKSGIILGLGVGGPLILALAAAEATRVHLCARARRIGFVRSVQVTLAQKETVRDLSLRMGLGRPS